MELPVALIIGVDQVRRHYAEEEVTPPRRRRRKRIALARGLVRLAYAIAPAETVLR
jgi:hypothetical protein